MNVIIDVREKKLIEKMKTLKNPDTIQEKGLLLGDIHITNSNNQLMAIFERKSLNDLLSSVCDGRYAEQSFRLNECDIHNHCIYYIIEGNISAYKDKTKSLYSKSTIYSCMYSLSYTKGFSVICTNNVDETAMFIHKMREKLEKEPNKSYYSNASTDNNVSTKTNNYIDTVNISKKSNINKDNIGIIMLAQIPGVSKNVAQVIIKKFKTIKELIKQFNKNENCMEGLTYVNVKNQTRKISKRSIENIKDFLLN
jgi:ERCC4-type nuclease